MAEWDATGKHKTTFAYDAFGSLVGETYPNGATVARYAYDSLGRLVREDNRPMNKTTLFSYDASGNILSKREWAYTAKKTAEVRRVRLLRKSCTPIRATDSCPTAVCLDTKCKYSLFFE